VAYDVFVGSFWLSAGLGFDAKASVWAVAAP